MSRVIGIGSALVDVPVLVPESFLDTVSGAKGGMELLDHEAMLALLDRLDSGSRVPGGSAVNTAVGVARLGLPARVLAKIGADEAGRFYRNALAAAGVETTALKRHAELGTGTCISLITPDSQRTLRTYLGASATLSPAEVTAADFTDCGHAHIEGYLCFNPELILHVLRTAKQSGCTVSLDLASPEVVREARPMLPGMIREYVDMVFANQAEAAAFAGTDDVGAALDALAGFCDLVAVKLGAEGALIQHREQRVQIPACAATAVDTTGAGDLWAAGFLVGWLRDADVREAGRIASHAGAAIVEVIGAVLPDEAWRRVCVELGLTSSRKASEPTDMEW